MSSNQIRLVSTLSNVKLARTAKIYRNSAYGEYRVAFYDAQGYVLYADYFTSDKLDAFGTAKYWVTTQETTA